MSPVAEYNLKDFLSLDPLPSGGRSFLRTFFGCLAAALSYLHENQIRHKDIKPQNILVKGHQIFLTDFGLSLDWSELGQSTTSGPTIKTPRYCAPEVADLMPRNSFSDVWSLGCVFLEIWTALKGEKIASLFEHLEGHGSKSTCYYLNYSAVIAWRRILEERPGTSEDNLPSAWISHMVQFDQDERWTVRTVFNHIKEANDDPNNRFAFCGLCCIGDEDSTDSARSSKRASANLDETGASSIGTYFPSMTAAEDWVEVGNSATDPRSSQTIPPPKIPVSSKDRPEDGHSMTVTVNNLDTAPAVPPPEELPENFDEHIGVLDPEMVNPSPNLPPGPQSKKKPQTPLRVRSPHRHLFESGLLTDVTVQLNRPREALLLEAGLLTDVTAQLNRPRKALLLEAGLLTDATAQLNRPREALLLE